MSNSLHQTCDPESNPESTFLSLETVICMLTCTSRAPSGNALSPATLSNKRHTRPTHERAVNAAAGSTTTANQSESYRMFDGLGDGGGVSEYGVMTLEVGHLVGRIVLLRTPEFGVVNIFQRNEECSGPSCVLSATSIHCRSYRCHTTHFQFEAVLANRTELKNIF